MVVTVEPDKKAQLAQALVRVRAIGRRSFSLATFPDELQDFYVDDLFDLAGQLESNAQLEALFEVFLTICRAMPMQRQSP